MSRSHHSGGSSGSSRSSGSSFSGSSRSHSSFSSSHSSHHDHMDHGSHHELYHHRSGIHMHYHSGYSVGSNPFFIIIGGIIFFMMLLGVFIFTSSNSSKYYDKELQTIEQSYNQYQSMISYAEQNPDYQIDAIIKEIKYDPEYELWYLEYSFREDYFGNLTITQETFAMYTQVEVAKMHKGDIIRIAIDDPSLPLNTNSINMDYKNVSLEEDAEYKSVLESKESQKKSRKIMIYVEIAFFAFVIFLIILGIKEQKKLKAEAENTTNTTENTLSSENTTNTTENTSTPTTNVRYCSYCGSKLPEGKNKCPLCGANTKD